MLRINNNFDVFVINENSKVINCLLNQTFLNIIDLLFYGNKKYCINISRKDLANFINDHIKKFNNKNANIYLASVKKLQKNNCTGYLKEELKVIFWLDGNKINFNF